MTVGLEGAGPETVNPDAVLERLAHVEREGRVALMGTIPVSFRPSEDLVLHRRERLPLHSNGMRFSVRDGMGTLVLQRIYYSVGGGFVVGEDEASEVDTSTGAPPHAFDTGKELLVLCAARGLSVSTLMLENECALRPEAEVRSGLQAYAHRRQRRMHTFPPCR